MQMRERDYKVDFSFAGNCAKDVAEYKCATAEHGKMMKSGLKPMTEALSSIVLCLENVIRNNQKVTPQCQNEMLVVRKQLLSDYQVRSSIIVHCIRVFFHRFVF